MQAPPENVLDLRLSTSPPITDIIATGPTVPLTTASMKNGESATTVTRENMRMRMAIRGSPKAHAQESHQPIHRPSDPRIEAVVTTIKKRIQSEAVTAPTDPTMTGVETMTRSIEATESDQSPQRSLSTAPADATYPVLIPTTTPTVIQISAMTHPSHRESGAPTMKITKTIIVTGNAPAAITKMYSMRKKTATAPPNPASVKSKNRDQTTTDLPKAQPRKKKGRSKRLWK